MRTLAITVASFASASAFAQTPPDRYPPIKGFVAIFCTGYDTLSPGAPIRTVETSPDGRRLIEYGFEVANWSTMKPRLPAITTYENLIAKVGQSANGNEIEVRAFSGSEYSYRGLTLTIEMRTPSASPVPNATLWIEGGKPVRLFSTTSYKCRVKS